MNFFDIAIIIIVAFCLVRGVFRGILGELSSIVGVVAGFYGAYNYHKEFTPLLEPYIKSEALIHVIIFFVLFMVIFAFVAVVAVILEKLLKVAFLGWIDKTFGAVFGAAKGILISAVIYIILTTFLPANSTLLSSSVLSPYIARVAVVMKVFISSNMSQGLMEKIESMDQVWKS